MYFVNAIILARAGASHYVLLLSLFVDVLLCFISMLSNIRGSSSRSSSSSSSSSSGSSSSSMTISYYYDYYHTASAARAGARHYFHIHH